MPGIKEGFKGERIIVLPKETISALQNDPLCRELYITDIGYYPHASFHYCRRRAEEVTTYVLIYCIEESGWVEVGGCRHSLHADQFIILPRGIAHAYGTNYGHPWTIYWLHFDGEKAAYFSDGFAKPHDITQNRHSRINDRLALFEELYGAASAGMELDYLRYATTSLFYFLGSMKFIGEYRGCRLIYNIEHKDLIENTFHYMKEHIAKHITVGQLAEKAHLSVSHFSHLFEQKTGLSPLRYLLQLRIQSACQYLANTNMKINQISPLVGFDNPLYFTRQFTKIIGCSPSAYRQSHKSL